MTTPSGQIGLSDVNTELGKPATTLIPMNASDVRALAGVPSGTISMNDLRNKSNTFTFSLSSGTNVNLATVATAAGWPGTAQLIANIPSAVTISRGPTNGYALTISGTFPQGVTLNNEGLIQGKGGNGGPGVGVNGGAGQTALLVSSPVTINNTGTIAGGGGGGGGTAPNTIPVPIPLGGPQIFGGDGGGGGAGAVAGTGGNGGPFNGPPSRAGTPGDPGTLTTGGAGAGDGGARGSAGQNTPVSTGGAAGGAVNGDPFITWTNTGTRIGAIT